MILLRFMSAHEAIRLLQGDTVHRDVDHKAQGNKTTSIGHCFVIVKEHSGGIYDSAKYLSGIAMMDACLIGTLKTNPDHLFEQTKGWYQDGWTPEICAVDYSLSDFDDWEICTPELPPYDQMFKMIASPNWLNPVQTASSHER